MGYDSSPKTRQRTRSQVKGEALCYLRFPKLLWLHIVSVLLWCGNLWTILRVQRLHANDKEGRWFQECSQHNQASSNQVWTSLAMRGHWHCYQSIRGRRRPANWWILDLVHNPIKTTLPVLCSEAENVPIHCWLVPDGMWSHRLRTIF